MSVFCSLIICDHYPCSKKHALIYETFFWKEKMAMKNISKAADVGKQKKAVIDM